MGKKNSNSSTLILVILLAVGLSIMFYPIVSDWWNSKVQSKAVASYNDTVKEMDENEAEAFIKEAQEYNKHLLELSSPFSQYDMIEGYNDILNISGTGIMGYINIPVIQSELLIYHGTSPEILNVAAGHLQGTSLPVGGANTHAVISAHRGLPSAKLFSDLNKLVEGDTFTITILDEVLTYEVEKIFIVNPNEMEKLEVIKGGDYVTLMTCTPYGINSHRLLIRAHRIETAYRSNAKVTSDAMQVDPLLAVPVISSPFVLILLIVWIFGGRAKPKPAEDVFGITGYKKDDE